MDILTRHEYVRYVLVDLFVLQQLPRTAAKWHKSPKSD